MQKRLSWILISICSLGVGLYPIIYFIIDRRFGLLSTKSEILLINVSWNIGFYGHIVFGGIALLIGWIQFSEKLRLKYVQLHRNIGKIYMVSVLISGLCGLYIALNATGGLVSIIGFFSLGIIWLTSTGLALNAIKNKNVAMHQKFMIYSYAACFGAVTLRIWLPTLTYVLGGFYAAYPIVAWVSWVPNIIVAYFITKRLSNKPTQMASRI